MMTGDVLLGELLATKTGGAVFTTTVLAGSVGDGDGITSAVTTGAGGGAA